MPAKNRLRRISPLRPGPLPGSGGVPDAAGQPQSRSGLPRMC